MAVIPLLQRDMAVSCHGRRGDLYAAALRVSDISDVNVKGPILHSYAIIRGSCNKLEPEKTDILTGSCFIVLIDDVCN